MVKSPVQAIGLVFLAKDCPLMAMSLSVHCDLGLLNLYQCHMFGKIFARPHNASITYGQRRMLRTYRCV